MDGDGEYEIILKWYPQKYAKDAASSGTTSNIIFDCYKLDGTKGFAAIYENGGYYLAASNATAMAPITLVKK